MMSVRSKLQKMLLEPELPPLVSTNIKLSPIEIESNDVAPL